MAKRFGILFLVCATAFLALAAYWLLFTTFMAHDDEGYVLISLKNYSAHGGLYAHVYSQYGPFFYFIHDAGHRLLGYDFTNTNGRLITLLCWMLATVLSASLAWQNTRSVALTGFTLTLTFFYLWLMVSEPIHPGGLITALVAVGAWGGAKLINRRAMKGLAGLTGIIGVILFLIKINVGLFFLISSSAWFTTQLCDLRPARFTSFVTAGLVVLLPLGLMHGELGEEWARIFAGLSAVASMTMLSVVWRDRQPLTQWTHGGYGIGIIFVVGSIVVGTVCLRGTDLHEMLEGILLGPLRHPGVYHFAPNWRPGAGWIGGFSLLLATLVWNGQSIRLSWFLIGLRLIIVALIGLASLELIPFTSHSSVMSYAIPLAWIFALRLSPPRDQDTPNIAGWVGLIVVLQYLHAYPVAGSQIAWGTFLIIPLMALGLHDTQRFIGARARVVFPAAIGVACFAVAAISAGRLCLIGWHHYTESRPLNLYGAEDVRPPENLASTLRLLTLNAVVHGDMLFSLPGMFSFNSWSQLPTPTLGNTTHWFSLLNQKQQEDIASALTRSKRPVLIIHRSLLEFLTDTKFVTQSSLHDYLNQNFERAFTIGKYEFWVRRGRTIVPLATAEFLQLKVPQLGLVTNKLELVVAIPVGSAIARIDLTTLEDKPRVLSQWDRSSGPLLSTAINLQGTAIAPEANSSWEKPLPRLVRLTLPLDKPVAFDRNADVIYLRDKNGAQLAEARFVD